jgi:hypothetical protein
VCRRDVPQKRQAFFPETFSAVGLTKGWRSDGFWIMTSFTKCSTQSEGSPSW